jgi:KaiC/GvpD/RAD55 family RecA-like ATPase
MARMIPTLLSPEIKSNAERKIFAWFRDAPDTDDWIVLHSLGIANHRNLIYGEIDFLALAPFYGIFALEVKGGRVSRSEGIWQFTDRYGKINTKTRGPFEQAQDGIFSIASAIKKKYGDDSKLSKIFFSSGVMFPDIEFKTDGIDTHQWMVFDKNDGDDVKRYIHRLSTNVHKQWEEKYNKYYEEKLPDRKDIKEIAKFLRGDFDKVVTLASSIKTVEEELIQLTAEQTKCLDQLEDNPRCLIEGGAGTGKTLLAIEAAKKAAASGEQIAFFCFNKLLAAWLKNYFEAVDSHLRPLYIGTFHDFIFEIAEKSGNKINQPEKTESDFWQTELPIAGLDAAEKLAIKYDRIIIDEAQDLINDNYLEVFDCILRAGLERGKWFIFGDFSGQAIFSSISEKEMKTILDDRTAFVRFRLKTNCRNTKPIVNEIMDITGFDKNNFLVKTEGPPVSFFTWKNREDQKEKLENLLERLKKEKIPNDQITILAPVRFDHSTAKTLSTPIANYSASPTGTISFSTIQAFKGLENSVIILIDIISYSNDPLMYVALSRARSSLFVFETEKARAERHPG